MNAKYSLADLCTSALLNALKTNLLYSKKTDSQAFRSAEVQSLLENFDFESWAHESHTLHLNEVVPRRGPPSVDCDKKVVIVQI